MPASNPTPKIRPLGPIAARLTQLFQPPPTRIANVETSAWPSPLQPVTPIGPKGSEPLQFNFNYGQNLIYTPRSDEPLTADELRALASYPLARMCIDNVISQITRIPVNVRLRRKPGETGKDYAKRKPDKGIIQAISDIIERPNPNQTRAQFLRQVLDDMLCIDAASVLLRTTKAGNLIEVRAIDGGTITRYIDEHGYTPAPPYPAYAQLWYGIPRVELNTDQLIYAARYIPTYRLYGMSPTEEAAPFIEIGIERLKFKKLAYTAGTIPDAIQMVPMGPSPDQVEEAQRVLNSQMAGNLAKRRGLLYSQGFTKEGTDKIYFPKEQLLKDDYDDYELSLLCFYYGASRQRLIKQMNRASAQAGQDAAEDEGLAPWIDSVENLIYNPLFQDRCGFKDYECTFEQNQEVDPEKQANIDKIYISIGKNTINEVREAQGEDPRPEPECDEPLIITATGPVPLSLDSRAESAQTMSEATFQPEPEEDDDEPPKGKKKPGAKTAPKKKVSKLLTSRAIEIDPGRSTPSTLVAHRRINDACVKVFRRQKDRAVEATSKLMKRLPVRKAEGDELTPEEVAGLIYEAIEAEWQSLPAEVVPALEHAMLSGINDGILQVQIGDTNLIQAANQVAREFARERAAEMVGMKYDEDGLLVPNPNAEWVISDTTRDEIRRIVEDAFAHETKMSDLVSSIADAGAFSDYRAHMIADTEVANAAVRGNFHAWQRTGAVTKVKWLTSADHDVEDECDLNENEEVPLGKAFPSGDMYPPAHPFCRCVLLAVGFRE